MLTFWEGKSTTLKSEWFLLTGVGAMCLMGCVIPQTSSL